MTNRRRPHTEHDHSPWLDNTTRPYLPDGSLARTVNRGIFRWRT